MTSIDDEFERAVQEFDKAMRRHKWMFVAFCVQMVVFVLVVIAEWAS